MKYYLKTYGCRANQYDSEAVRAMLAEAGAVEVPSPRQADVAIFNSCTVTASAEADLRKDVRRAARQNPLLRSAVMGCAAAIAGRDEAVSPVRTLPSVFEVVPAADLGQLAAALGIASTMPGARTTVQSGSRALLRIQDGCDEHCTFCATTVARGANRSRPMEEILREAERLAEVHHEIVITGIHIGTYGCDTGLSLGRLVEALVRRVPAARFRLSSVEATEVDDRLRELLTAGEGLAPHLHAPLQSGSDKVLKRMGRHWYSANAYARRVRELVGARTVFGLGADVICGFPGETEDEHRATINLVADLPFTSLHVFPYSPRPGSPAARLGPACDSTTVTRRAAELRALGSEMAAAHASSRCGGPADVVTTGIGGGLTEDYLSVKVPIQHAGRRRRFAAVLQAAGGGILALPA